MANDSLAETVAASNGRFAGTASLPMQDPDAAAEEYRRCVQELGFVGAHVGTTIEGEYVDRDTYLPLWEAVDELGAPVILHPYYIGPKVGYEDYYLTNIFVNPLDTALAAGRLIFSGLFDRFENLKFVLVHAGVFLPYQIGRFDHGWKVRQESRISLDRPPSEYLDRFYFDTITHHDRAVEVADRPRGQRASRVRYRPAVRHGRRGSRRSPRPSCRFERDSPARWWLHSLATVQLENHGLTERARWTGLDPLNQRRAGARRIECIVLGSRDGFQTDRAPIRPNELVLHGMEKVIYGEST